VTQAVLASLLAGVVGVTGGPAFAQTLGQASGPEVSWWRVIGALVFCCLLGVAGALALKYRMRHQAMPGKSVPFDPRVLNGLFQAFRGKSDKNENSDSRLKVVSTVRLSYQVEVSLLEADGKTVMIVTSPQGAFVINPDAPSTPGTPS
jgi:hypothetical protein